MRFARERTRGRTRMTTCRLWRAIGDRARPAIPLLESGLDAEFDNGDWFQDETIGWDGKIACAGRLGGIPGDDPKVLEPLIAACRTKESAEAAQAAEVLARMGPAAAPAVPALVGLLPAGGV